MPQFALLSVPVFIVMNLLSGGITPPEDMPLLVRAVMSISPSPISPASPSRCFTAMPGWMWSGRNCSAAW